MSDSGPALPLSPTAAPAAPSSATATMEAASSIAPSVTATTTATTTTIPASSNPGIAQKKRIRAVVACSHCRSKRSKCDGIPGRQACTECQQRGIDCEMTDGKRNRGHYKPQAEALAKKVRLLEEALVQSRAANLELLAEKRQLQGHVNGQNGVREMHIQPPMPNILSHDTSRMDIVSTPPVQVYTVPAPLPVLDPLPSIGTTIPSLLNRSQTSPSTGTVGTSAHSASLMMPPPPAHTMQQNQAANNATHNPVQLVMDHGHVVFSRTSSPTNQEKRKTPPPPEPTAVAVGAPFPLPSDRPRPCSCADLDLSAPLVDYLLGLFFHRYQMMLKFVSQEDFMRKYSASSARSSQHFSHSPLFLAMLAAGVRYSTRRDVTARFLLANGENKLATAAKAAVEIEVSRPTLATVQTVLILCEVETSLDRQMTGYMYSCLASKMVYGMGIDLGQLPQAVRETMTPEETAIRHWIVWAASVHDQFWSVFLRRPLAIKNETLQQSRLAWRSARSALSPAVPSFEDEVNDALMDLMILAREITNSLYGAAPVTNTPDSGRSTATFDLNDRPEPSESSHHHADSSPPSSPPYDGGGLPSALYEQATQRQARRQRPDVAHLDARLDSWFNSLTDRIRQGPINGHSSYHYLFILHLHYNATKIMIHRTRGFSLQPTSLNGNRDSVRDHPSVPASSYPLQSPVTPPASSSGDPNTPGIPSSQSAMSMIDHATAQSVATLGRASICMARLFESFRRREDIRMLQTTGVQWAGMASEALTWYIETLPIDGAIEAVAHLQSLARTLKDMARTFRPAVYPYDRTNHAIQMFQQRMESSFDSPRTEAVHLAPSKSYGGRTPAGPDLTWMGHGYSGLQQQSANLVSTPRPQPSLHGGSTSALPPLLQHSDPSLFMSPGAGVSSWMWADQDPWDWNELLQHQ